MFPFHRVTDYDLVKYRAYETAEWKELLVELTEKSTHIQDIQDEIVRRGLDGNT